jgi:hypothetical protein
MGDLAHREREYLESRETPSRVEADRRHTITCDDAAFLGRLDRAFQDE